MKPLHLLQRPPQMPHLRRFQIRNQLHQIMLIPSAQLLQMPILQPRINRPTKHLLLNINKSHFFHAALVILHDSEVTTYGYVAGDD